MPKFKYIDKLGQEKEVEANSPTEAIAIAPDRATNSGVQTISEPVDNIRLKDEVNNDPNPDFDLKTSGIGTTTSTEEDEFLSEIVEQKKKGASKEIDSDDIRRRNLMMFQDQIDAVNEIYGSLISDEKIDGTDRLGQGRAIQNRQGLIGSARGGRQKDNIVAKNQAAVQALQAERAFKINQIQGLAQQRSLEEIQAEKAAKQQSASDYLTYLGLQDERREGRVKEAIGSLISQGYSLDDLTGDEFDELSQSLKVSGDKLRTTYDSLLPETEEEEDGQFTLGSTSSSSGSTGGDSPTVEVMSFDEFKSSSEAQQVIDEAQNKAQQSFPQERRDRLLEEYYNSQIEDVERSTGAKAITVGDSSGKVTPTVERDLNQAGLTNADDATKSFFINLPNRIKDTIQRGVADGTFTPEELTIENMNTVLKEEGSSSNSSNNDDEPDFDKIGG